MYLSSHFLANLGLSDVLKTADLAGIPLPWPQATPPAGWLKCNGQAFDKNAFPKLALAYPGGVLPDLRGEFIRGWDDGRGVDAGRTLLSFQNHEMLSHTHGVPINGTAGENWTNFPRGDSTSTDGYVQTTPTGGTETRPRNIAFSYIVRAA
ncbi:phage tail protein [Dickeya fangzhongdai]|uniref:phage tail protein n=1 Tax=Dickeya fangzhongdai TaxID=1778540 RepID=UPI000EAC3ED7|nr:phage tail protein [Dickeya fangzhongdai]AYH48473.1 phage tail protein [Dickeya fangzhongdai]UWH05738.1 tail fiber protein [Dickeya fangzhongdai]